MEALYAALMYTALFLTIRLNSGLVSVKRLNDDCDIINITMTCKIIPETVPRFVRNVIILDHRGRFEHAFLGQGWKHVTSLSLAGDTDGFDNDQFRGLSSIESLALQFANILQFPPKVFVNTPNIQMISFLGMGKLGMNSLITSLTHPGVLKNLTELSINPGVNNYPPQMYISNNLTQRFLDKPLIKLNVSQTIILIDLMALVTTVLKVDVLNLTGSFIALTDELPLPVFRMNDGVPLLKVGDLSDAILPYSHNNLLPTFLSNYKDIHNPLSKIEHLYVDHYFHVLINITQCYNASVSKVFWKSIYFRRNNIHIINCTCIFGKDNTLGLIDLSENEIQYISPQACSTAIHLTTINLSDNRLFYMQRMPEFEVLFSPFTNLSVLHLSENGLSYLPWNIFSNNHNLKILNLAGNQLSSVDFNLVNLTNLATLDLSGNLINYIEGESLARLSVFVDAARQKKSNKFEIFLQDNPLLCLCKSVKFIQWLFMEGHNSFTQSAPYKCTYMGSSITIDEKAIEKSDFLCKRAFIIVFSSLGLAITTVLVCFTVYYIRASVVKRRLRRTERDFKQAYNDGTLKEEYICFLAYAVRDEELVEKTVLRPLDNLLIEKLNTNKRPVSTGHDFTPGRPIYEEAYRYIQKSCVFIAVVSEAFCESEYCQGEIREAYTQQKPIIVILLGTVTETKMSPYLLEVFRRNARAKMIEKEDGGLEIIPDLNTTTESALNLAAIGYVNEM